MEKKATKTLRLVHSTFQSFFFANWRRNVSQRQKWANKRVGLSKDARRLIQSLFFSTVGWRNREKKTCLWWRWHCYCGEVSSQLLSSFLSWFSTIHTSHLPFLTPPSLLLFLTFTAPTPLSLFHPSLVSPSSTNTASSTKMTYVSYNNHAIWRGPQTTEKKKVGGDRRKEGLDGREGACHEGRGPNENGVRLSWPSRNFRGGKKKVSDAPRRMENPSMRHFVLFCIKPQRRRDRV